MSVEGGSSSIQINGVECTFHLGADGEEPAIVESFPETGPVVTLLLKCAWDERMVLVYGLLGSVGYLNETIIRVDPFPFPLQLGQTIGPINSYQFGGGFAGRLLCTSVGEIRGIKWATDQDGFESETGIVGWGLYDEAIVPANFTVPLWQTTQNIGSAFADPIGKPYCVTKIKSSGEVFSPPTGSLIYGGGNFAGQPLVDIHGAQIRTRQEISVTLMRMPIVPSVTISNCQGGVNADVFPIGGVNYPMGSVLLASTNTDPRADPVNYGIVQDVELCFLANAPTQDVGIPLDWNMFMDPSGAWVQVLRNLDPPIPVFPYVHFGSFFLANIT